MYLMQLTIIHGKAAKGKDMKNENTCTCMYIDINQNPKQQNSSKSLYFLDELKYYSGE